MDDDRLKRMQIAQGETDALGHAHAHVPWQLDGLVTQHITQVSAASSNNEHNTQRESSQQHMSDRATDRATQLAWLTHTRVACTRLRCTGSAV